MGTVKGWVALIIGASLLVTLPACEGSRHAEVMSTEDARAQSQMSAVPDTETATGTASGRGDMLSEGASIDREPGGLSESFGFGPESPPSPVLSGGDEGLAAGSVPGSSSQGLGGARGGAVVPGGAVSGGVVPGTGGSDTFTRLFPHGLGSDLSAAAVPGGAVSGGVVPGGAVPGGAVPGEAIPGEAIPDGVVPGTGDSDAFVSDGVFGGDGFTEETLSAEEPAMAGSEVEIASLAPSDFVPEASAAESQGRQDTPGDGDTAAGSTPGRMRDNKASGLEDVFFDFDQYAIRLDAVSVLKENARLLNSTYANSNVLIEGHCDERGTVEYNLELGKRRAQAAKDYLVNLGVEQSRIRIVSYGKERPFCTESNPSCWKQNRRGYFVRQ